MKLGIIASTIVVTSLTLSAGLWPFSFYVRNGASWSADHHGLYFSGFGTATGSSPYDRSTTCANHSDFSLELWVQPDKATRWGTILAFGSKDEQGSFAVRQSLDDIQIVHSLGPGDYKTNSRSLYVDNAFATTATTFLTVSVSDAETSVFLNGHRIPRTRDLGIKCGDLAGTLVLGTAISSNDTWTGTVLGLAAYNRSLGAEGVEKHFRAWTQDSHRNLKSSLDALALYVFDERTGDTVHDLESEGKRIAVPDNYSIVNKRFLQPFWEEFSWDRAYASDIALNIIGFIPLGICLAALLDAVVGARHPLATTTLLCLATSLSIEVLQAFIPIRYSGTTDLITNTCGGALGANLYWVFVKRILIRQPL